MWISPPRAPATATTRKSITSERRVIWTQRNVTLSLGGAVPAGVEVGQNDHSAYRESALRMRTVSRRRTIPLRGTQVRPTSQGWSSSILAVPVTTSPRT